MNVHRGGQAAAPPGERVETRARGRAWDERSQAAAEFALALPVLMAVLVATLVFGIVFNNSAELTYATGTGAQQLAISRGETTDPCATASNAIIAAAPNLKASNLTFKLSLTSTSGSYSFSGTSCPTSSNTNATLEQAETAQVTTQYPCSLQLFGYNLAPTCTLTAQTAVYVQ